MRTTRAITIAAILLFSSLSLTAYILREDVNDNGYPLYYTDSLERFDLPDLNTPDRGILNSLDMAGQYLTNHVETSGKWDYLYYPLKDGSSTDYNILRHAGTSYSMALIFKYTHILDYYNTTIITINNLLENYLRFEPGKGGQIAYISDDYRVKLGGAALTSLALTAISEVDPILNYSRELDGLGRFMVEMITESGKFQCYLYPDQGEHNDYYPGEALLALARLYDYTGKGYYLSALNSSWDFYLDYYGSGSYTPFTPWGTEALYHMYRFTGDERYPSLAVKMARHAMRGQHKPEYSPDERYIGGFGTPPRANTASRIEGPIDANRVCSMMGDNDTASEFRGSIDLSVDFLMNLQLNRSEAQDFSDPEMCTGGFTLSFDDLEIRIDYVQHAAVVFAKVIAYGSGLEKV